MKMIQSKRFMGLFISLVLIFAFCVTPSLAQKKIKVAGEVITAYTIQHKIDVEDTKGHSLYVLKSEGINKSTGENKFMCGAETVYVAFGDYVMGNGPHVTYSKMSLNGDVVFSEAKGMTKTTLSSKGKPVTTVEGTMKMTKGTGQYEGIQGEGTYKGKLISSTILVYEWEGEYFIKK